MQLRQRLAVASTQHALISALRCRLRCWEGGEPREEPDMYADLPPLEEYYTPRLSTAVTHNEASFFLKRWLVRVLTLALKYLQG